MAITRAEYDHHTYFDVLMDKFLLLKLTRIDGSDREMDEIEAKA